MFVEPFFAMILGDFVVRLCILRNERTLANKLQPINNLIGALSILRFCTTGIPEILNITTKLDESNILVKIEGLTRYELVSETYNARAYQLVEGFCIMYSIVLIGFLTVWLKTRFL